LPDVHAGYGFAIGKLEKRRKKHLKYLLVVQHSTAKLLTVKQGTVKNCHVTCKTNHSHKLKQN
jgi:hypothetical protein